MVLETFSTVNLMYDGSSDWHTTYINCSNADTFSNIYRRTHQTADTLGLRIDNNELRRIQEREKITTDNKFLAGALFLSVVMRMLFASITVNCVHKKYGKIGINMN